MAFITYGIWIMETQYRKVLGTGKMAQWVRALHVSMKI